MAVRDLTDAEVSATRCTTWIDHDLDVTDEFVRGAVGRGDLDGRVHEQVTGREWISVGNQLEQVLLVLSVLDRAVRIEIIAHGRPRAVVEAGPMTRQLVAPRDREAGA